MRGRAAADARPGHVFVDWQRIAELEHRRRTQLIEQHVQIVKIAGRQLLER